jgi:hypothetical protein
MALPLPPGLTPLEIAFLCEMELVTIVPRQRLEGLELLGVCNAPQTPRRISPGAGPYTYTFGDSELRLYRDA